MVRALTSANTVREGGFEPPRPCGHWHLKPARLPFRHSRLDRASRVIQPRKASTPPVIGRRDCYARKHHLRHENYMIRSAVQAAASI